ncbi:MAG: tRNA (adenosine(37)-N6)-threonylcarbamoyltransferase complex ATPase subunit type 1 TsaE [Nitrospinales bacterium]
MQITAKSRAETITFGENLGKSLKSGDVVLLFGDLGSGKTTLTQGIARGLGLKKGEYIRSPTFTLINEYQGTMPIYHIDLYRLQTFEEVENLGLEEVLFSGGVAVVEWAEKLFPNPSDRKSIGFGIDARIDICITIMKDDARLLDIRSVNKSSPGVFTLL